MPRYLIAADPVEALNPEFDLGVCVSQGLLARGIPVDYLDLLATDVARPTEAYLRELPVREVREADREREAFWDLGHRRLAPVTEYDVILQRKDPPVDARFIAYGQHFAAAPRHILQINRPPATHEYPEHALHLRFPEYAAPTRVCRSWEAFRDAVREQDRRAVCKPLNTFSGMGVTAFPPEAEEAVLRDFWEKWRPAVTVQPFLEEIRTIGDLRILTIQERVLGSVLRLPPKGGWIANLHAGGTAAARDPTPRQLAACRAVARALNPLGLHLLGLDFIGEYLTEVNITSPTLVVQINQVMGKRADLELIEEIERLRREQSAT